MSSQFYFLKRNQLLFINSRCSLIFFNGILFLLFNMLPIFLNIFNSVVSLKWLSSRSKGDDYYRNKLFFTKNFKKIKITFINKSFKIKKASLLFNLSLNKSFLVFLSVSNVLLKLKKKNLLFISINKLGLIAVKSLFIGNIYTKKGFFIENSVFKWKKGKN